MKQMILAVIIVASFGCASNPAVPRNVQLEQDVVAAIRILDVTAKGIEGAADAKPPLITRAEANQALDGIKATIRVLQSTNSCAHSVLTTALTQLEMLPVAQKIRPVLDAAHGFVGNGFWQLCATTQNARPVIEDGVSWVRK